MFEKLRGFTNIFNLTVKYLCENEEIRNGGGNDKQENSHKIKNRVSNKKKVKFDWIPPNVSDTLVRKIRV